MFKKSNKLRNRIFLKESVVIHESRKFPVFIEPQRFFTVINPTIRFCPEQVVS